MFLQPNLVFNMDHAAMPRRRKDDPAEMAAIWIKKSERLEHPGCPGSIVVVFKPPDFCLGLSSPICLVISSMFYCPLVFRMVGCMLQH